MILPEKIRNFYTEITDFEFDRYIVVQNDSDGRGDYIAKWEHPTLTRPTQEQLDSVEE